MKKQKIYSLTILMCIGLSSFAQLPTYIPAQGLRAYYPFAGNANDASGNQNHLTVNGATLTADRFSTPASAYYFNGNSYMSGVISPSLNNDWTISGWYLVNSFNNNFNTYYAMGLGFTPNANGFGFGGQLHACYPMKYGMYDGGIGSGCVPAQSLHGNIIPNYTQWIHVVLVKSTTSYSFFFNGQYDNSANRGTMTISNYEIGRRMDGILNYRGVMDEIAIWDRALSPGEILTVYNGPLAGLSEQSRNESLFEVYPSPAMNYVEVERKQKQAETSYQIIDVLGKAIKTGILTEANQIIDVSDLPSAVYFVQINGASKRFVKIRE